MGSFNHFDICWKDNTEEGGMLHLIFTNKKGLTGDVKVKGSLGHSDHKLKEFSGPFQSQPLCDSIRAEDTGSIYKVLSSLDIWIMICQKYKKYA